MVHPKKKLRLIIIYLQLLIARFLAQTYNLELLITMKSLDPHILQHFFGLYFNLHIIKKQIKRVRGKLQYAAEILYLYPVNIASILHILIGKKEIHNRSWFQDHGC